MESCGNMTTRLPGAATAALPAVPFGTGGGPTYAPPQKIATTTGGGSAVGGAAGLGASQPQGLQDVIEAINKLAATLRGMGGGATAPVIAGGLTPPTTAGGLTPPTKAGGLTPPTAVAGAAGSGTTIPVPLPANAPVPVLVNGGPPPKGNVTQATPVQAGGPVAASAVVHTSLHGTVLAATETSVTLRDDAGITATYAIAPGDLANMDLPHLLEKHVKTGKTLDLVYRDVNGVRSALGYSHPPSPPTVPPTPPSAVPHSAIHGTVAALTDTTISLRDDSGVITDYAITAANIAQLDMPHLREKHLTGKALNLVFVEKDGVKQALSYNHPA